MNTPLLERAQYRLLAQFVQAPRGEFFITQSHDETEATFVHLTTNDRFQGDESDAEILVSNRLLIKSDGCYAVTPAGVDLYNRVAAAKVGSDKDE
jgi:hypothetical protein